MSPEPSTTSPQLNPPEQAFVSLLHAVPNDDLGRCTVVTAAVLSIWQLAGSAFSVSAPSFLLVNGQETSDEAFETVVRLMHPIFSPAFPPPQTVSIHPETNDFRGDRDHIRTTMRAALASRRKLAARNLDPASVKRQLDPWFDHWQQGKAALFPALEINHYDQAFDRDFGLVSGHDDCISLIVLSEDSRTALRRDLAKRPDRLLAPQGFSNQLDPVTKRVALTGSLPLKEWDTELVNATLSLPRPLFYLPHFLERRVVIEHLQDLVQLICTFTRLHRRHPGAHFTDSNQPPLLGYFPAYENLIRRLSTGLPGDRDFTHRTLIRQLDTVTHHIALAAGHGSLDSSVTQAMHADLYRTTLRGIAYSLAALKYHAHGVGLGSHRPAAGEVLSHVRLRGDVSRRNLQRKVYTLNAENLGHLLERLEGAGLFSTEGKMVRPVSFEKFLKVTPARERFSTCRLDTTVLLRASA
jgi:hypothetical protein